MLLAIFLKWLGISILKLIIRTNNREVSTFPPIFPKIGKL